MCKAWKNKVNKLGILKTIVELGSCYKIKNKEAHILIVLIKIKGRDKKINRSLDGETKAKISLERRTIKGRDEAKRSLERRKIKGWDKKVKRSLDESLDGETKAKISLERRTIKGRDESLDAKFERTAGVSDEREEQLIRSWLCFFKYSKYHNTFIVSVW